MADALKRFRRGVRSANVLYEHAQQATFTKRCEARRLRKAKAKLAAMWWQMMSDAERQRVFAERDAKVRKFREQAKPDATADDGE